MPERARHQHRPQAHGGRPDRVVYKDLLYVRRRFITRESLRDAVARVVNATLRTRHPGIWGEGTTACAANSKQFGAWDQNLYGRFDVKGIS